MTDFVCVCVRVRDNGVERDGRLIIQGEHYLIPPSFFPFPPLLSDRLIGLE